MATDTRDVGGRPSVATGEGNYSQNVTARLDREHVVALDLLADLRGTTRSDLIREAVHGLLTNDPEEGTA